MTTSSAEKSFEQKTLENIQKQYIQINTILLGIHVFLTIPYMLLSPRYMMPLNIFSILFYVLGYCFLKKSRRIIAVYSFLILMEILIHDIFCVLIFGWECGFQLWILSLAGTYIKDYLTPEKSERQKSIYTNLIMMLGFFSFIALYLITKYISLPFQDVPPDTVTTIFLIFNAFIAFTAMNTFTGIYTRQMEYHFTELHHQADYDQLTGLANRYYINDLLSIEERKANEASGYSVAIIDIDFFKKVNDTYGHDNGDVVLRNIADILSDYLPGNYKAGRWGGEEFIVISDQSVSYTSFQQILEEIRTKIGSYDFILENKQHIHCTVSIGAFTYRKGYSVQEVIKKADENLYAAKNAGRNRLVT